MRRFLLGLSWFIVSLLFITTKVSAQDTTGLVAHWDFNGSTNDVTGHGNDGIPHNVTPDVGRSGLPNTAYYFVGNADPSSNSWIEIPYHTDLNVTEFSICATIKVYGFYAGPCQGNTIFERGKDLYQGNYLLNFDDQIYDHNNCNSYNPSHETFKASPGVLKKASPWYNTSPIKPNQWMTVVATFDSGHVRIYVNGTLQIAVADSATMRGSLQGADIGLSYLSGDAYPFNGLIDDMRLYNRPLSADEVQQYDSSTLEVGEVTKNTPLINIYPNPAKDIIYIQGNIINKVTHIKVCNTLGQIVKNITLSNGQRRLSVAELAPAVYFLQVQTEDGQIATKEFIKQ